MKITLKKYIRFWFWIDLVGLVFSIILIVSYLIWGDNVSAHLQNLWSNLSIDVLGVWLSVRIIDFLLQRHRTFKEIRFQLLRNFDYFENVAANILIYGPKERDINLLEREMKYFDKRWPKRKKHFFNDEKEQVNALMKIRQEIVDTCKQLAYKGNIESDEVDYKKLKEILREQLFMYRNSLEKFTENVWEETNPDD